MMRIEKIIIIDPSFWRIFFDQLFRIYFLVDNRLDPYIYE